MILSDLWNKTNYISEFIDFIISKCIVEMDIQKANISVLAHKGIISPEQYLNLFRSDRNKRLVHVGLMQRDDPEITECLKSGITEIRKTIFDIFNISDYNLISIKNDAIFFILDPMKSIINNDDRVLYNRETGVITITHPYFNNQDGFIHVIPKNIYSSYYRLNKKELLYRKSRLDVPEMLHISGINDDKILLHEDYLCDFLKALFETAETNGVAEALNILNNFYMSYINKQVPIGYYRRFDSFSRFDLNHSVSDYADFCADFIDVNSVDLSDIDISYNESMLRKLQRIYSTIYFSSVK